MKTIKTKLAGFILLLLASASLFLTCDVGLGNSVSTKPPSVSITSPAANSDIAGTLTMTGSAAADTFLTSVAVTLIETSSGAKLGPFTATVDATAKTWSIALNKTAGSREIPDGTYKVTVVATDSANRTSEANTVYQIDNTVPTVLVTSPLTYGSSGVPEFYQTIDVKGEVYDASTLKQVHVQLLSADGSSILAEGDADGTNTWTKRFDYSSGVAGPLKDGTSYCYNIIATDAAGNANVFFYHRSDIYPLLSVNSDGYVTFPSMYDFGRLDQIASVSSLSDGLTKAILANWRHGVDSSAAQKYPDFKFWAISSATVKFLNLSGSSPAINVGVPIVGTILPPADGSAVMNSSLSVDIWHTNQDSTQVHYSKSSISGTTGGTSVNFTATPLANDDSPLSSGVYYVQIKYKTNASAHEFVSPVQKFTVSASAPKFTSGSDGSNPLTSFAQSTVNSASTITGYAFQSDGKTPLTSDLISCTLDSDNDSLDRANVPVTVGADGSFSIAVAAASDHTNDGSNTYTIAAKAGTNSDALTTTISRMFVVDTRAPTITPLDPTDNIWIDSSGGTISLSGTASDAYTVGSTEINGSGVSKVYWSVSDTAADYSSVTDFSSWNKATRLIAWSGSYTAAGVGKYLLWVCAVDVSGNIGRRVVPFNLDKDPPAISIDSDTSAYYTTSTLPLLKAAGTVSDDNSGVSLTAAVNGGAATSIPISSGNWSWSPSVTTDGSYTVVFTATDIAGKKTSLTRKYTIDTVGPALSVTNLDANGTTMFSSPTGLITGKMSDANGIAKLDYSMDSGANWNDTHTIASDWTQSVAGLSEGTDKNIKFRATDSAGNTTTLADYAISLDCTPPNASFGTTTYSGTCATVSDVETTNNAFAFTNGAMDDATATVGRPAKTAILSYTKDGQAAGSVTLHPSSSSLTWNWTSKNDALSPSVNLTDGNHDGLYVFTLTVTDLANKVATAQKIIRIDTKAPTLIISVPTANDINTTGSYKIQGSALDLGSGTASVSYVLTNGTVEESSVSADLDGTLWSKTLDLTAPGRGEGTKKLTVIATDKLGNSTPPESIVFYYDAAAPDLQETTIGVPDTQYTNKEITFAGTWAETNGLSTIAISYKKDSDAAVSLAPSTINDKTTGTGTKTWSYTTSGLADKFHDGSYVFTITATDVANRTSTVTRKVKIDTSKPTLTLGTNLNVWQRSTDVAISGTASDSSGAVSSGIFKVQYSLDNGATWSDLTGTGSWNGTIPVGTTAGASLKLKSIDNAGNESDVTSATVMVDAEKPKFVETVENTVSLTNVSQTFSGTVSDNLALASSNPVTLTRTKNGTVVTTDNSVPITGSSWSYTQTAKADHSEDGAWVLTFTATDSSGLTSTVTKSFTVDTTAPAVTISSPAAGQTGLNALSGASYSFIGTANDAYAGTSKVYYLIDKIPAASKNTTDYAAFTAGNGTWNFSKSLGTGPASSPSTIGEGSWYLHAYADDALGNTGIESAATVQFDVDQAYPTLKETAVNTADDQFTSASAIVVYSGSASDTNAFGSLKVKITEVLGGITQTPTESTITVAAGGSWTYSYKASSDDSSATLEFIATDVVGKTSSVTRKIVVDKTPPTVTIDTDFTGWQRSTNIAISGTASDTNGTVNSGVKKVQYSIDGGTTWVDLTGTAHWSGAMNIGATSGKPLKVRSIDNAGNMSAVEDRLVKADAEAPSFGETTANAVVATNVDQTFSGTVDDNLALSSTPVTLTRKLNGVAVTSGNTVTISGSSAPYSWSFTQPVDITSAHSLDGVWELTFTATDSSGLTKTITKSYTIDTTAPTLVVSSPALNDCVSAYNCAIGGKAYDTGGYGFAGHSSTSGGVPADVQYSLDNTNWIDIGSLAGTTSWSKSNVAFESTEGSKTFWVRATDAVGNQASTKVDFYYDLAPPTLNETTLKTTDTKYYNGNFSFGGTWSETNKLVSIGVSLHEERILRGKYLACFGGQ